MKIEFQGQMVDATEVEVLTEKESWNIYQLSDGKELSIKTILASVYRADSQKGLDGSPMYLTKTSQVIKVR